ncbi:hypothetical protein RFI_31002 [Reticulomyxa filosa]|uniref:ZNF598/HEL2 PAH domain-containing protein n=1 Tax=Reticulomyxa filosa TaxID=46433 RepID=X6M0B8_RETFI|nr:hypothetical protein RFI_31002 [Reticulomyxa filosa]|eukprot:ETO06395.1 hypothetical protein RFI_31002 [Reticulomyxa filosa]
MMRIQKILVTDKKLQIFQQISEQFDKKRMRASDFFLQFKSLFSPLCEEDVWVDVMMQMLSLLTDHVLRRQLYSEYKTWKLTGRTTAQLHSTPQQAEAWKAPSNAQPTAASIVAGKARRVRGHGTAAYNYPSARQSANVPSLPLSTMTTQLDSTQEPVIAAPQQLQGAWARGTPVMQVKKAVKPNSRPKVQKVQASAKPKEAIPMDPKNPLFDKYWPALDKPPPLPVLATFCHSHISYFVLFYVDETFDNKKKIEFSSDSEEEDKKKKKNRKEANKKKKAEKRDDNEKKQSENVPKNQKEKNEKKNKPQPPKTSEATKTSSPLKVSFLLINQKKKKREQLTKGLMPHEKARGKFSKENPWGAGAKPQGPAPIHVDDLPTTESGNNQPAVKEKQEEKKKEKAQENRPRNLKQQSAPLQELMNASKSIDSKNAELLRKLESYEEEIEEMDRSKVFAFLLYLFQCCVKSLQDKCGTGEIMKQLFTEYMLSPSFRNHIHHVIQTHFVSSPQFHKDMPIYACFGTQVFAVEILKSLPKWSEATAVAINGLLSLITDVRLEQIEEFREWIDQTIQMLSKEELYGLSLYLWFVLETQIPIKGSTNRNESKSNEIYTQPPTQHKNENKKVPEQAAPSKKPPKAQSGSFVSTYILNFKNILLYLYSIHYRKE